MTLDEYVLSFVMAGGLGSRLKILTRDRTKPAVGILGSYRIFDFVATNIADTGIPAMMIAAQFEPRSLARHIGSGSIWGFDGIDRKIEIVQPYGEGRNIVTFEGTADCVRKNMGKINQYNPGIVLVLAGDHIYSMNYEDAIKHHKMNNADITIMAHPVSESKVSDLGILKIDENNRVIDFTEKPTDNKVIDDFRLTERIKSSLGINDPNLEFLASMGNYIFFRERLEKFLAYGGNDFGKDTIPAVKKDSGGLYAYIFNGYWQDVGKIKDYFDCNMTFATKRPIDLMRKRIRSPKRLLPDAWIPYGGSAEDSILSLGNEIYGTVKNSVLGYQVIVEEKSMVDHCVFLGADLNEFFGNEPRQEYFTVIGKGSQLSYVILDKNVRIGRNVHISPGNGTPEEREEKLKGIGLKPYKEKEDGTGEGDFYIDPDTNILVIGKQYKQDFILPDNFEC